MMDEISLQLSLTLLKDSYNKIDMNDLFALYEQDVLKLEISKKELELHRLRMANSKEYRESVESIMNWKPC